MKENTMKTRLDEITARYSSGEIAPVVARDLIWLLARVRKLEKIGKAVVTAHDTNSAELTRNVEQFRDALEMPIPDLPDDAWTPIP
jgi:predicted nucleic acid-binding protein